MRTVTALLFLIAIPAYASTDRCSGRIPAGLAEVLIQKNPGYRLPNESDNLAEDVEYNLSAKGTGCLAVTSADFDGDGQLDYLVALPAKDSKDTVIAAALRRGKTWLLEPLSMWPNSQGRVFVETHAPGRYERTGALEGPVSEPDEVLALDCRDRVAVFGFTESSAVAYCRRKKGWQFVWVSD